MTYSFVKLSRGELIDLFSDLGTDKPHSFSAKSATPSRPEKGECIVVWPSEDAIGWPSTFVVDDSSLPDFLAWVSTYARSFTPFTAHFRVITWLTFNQLQERPFLGALPFNQKRRRLGALGLIFGEAFAGNQRYQKLIQMSLHAFRSTISYPLARALSLSIPPEEGMRVMERALRLQSGNSHASSSNSEYILRSIWSELLATDFLPHSSLLKSSLHHRDAVRALLENGVLPESILLEVTENNREMLNFVPKDQDILEDRMNNLNKLLMAPEFMRLREENRALLAGYSLSRIAPGTLDHLSQLTTLREHSPGMTIWYCFCAGCAEGSHIEIDNMGLGRLLNREIVAAEDAFDCPHADIGINELEMVSLNSGNVELPRSLPGSLTVEMYPRIYMVIRTGPAPDLKNTGPNLVQEEVLSTVRVLLDQAQRAIARVSRDERSSQRRKSRP